MGDEVANAIKDAMEYAEANGHISVGRLQELLEKIGRKKFRNCEVVFCADGNIYFTDAELASTNLAKERFTELAELHDFLKREAEA